LRRVAPLRRSTLPLQGRVNLAAVSKPQRKSALADLRTKHPISGKPEIGGWLMVRDAPLLTIRASRVKPGHDMEGAVPLIPSGRPDRLPGSLRRALRRRIGVAERRA